MPTYLLLSETYLFKNKNPRIEEHVLEYTPGEIAELFTPEEIVALAEGRVATRRTESKLGTYLGIYTNMVVAARRVATEQTTLFPFVVYVGLAKAEPRETTVYAANPQAAIDAVKEAATPQEKRWATFTL